MSIFLYSSPVKPKVYSLDIRKDAFDADLEKRLAFYILGASILIGFGIVISKNIKNHSLKI